MKSWINVQYNVYAAKAEHNLATHLNRVTRTIYLFGSQFKLPRDASSQEQMRFFGHVNSTVRSSQCEMLEFSEEHKPNRRSTVCNDETVRRLYNLHIAIIYYGFTVMLVTLTAPWYCGRNLVYSH